MRAGSSSSFLLFDDLAQAASGLLLLFRPETVTFDETQRVIPPSPSFRRCVEGSDPEPRDSGSGPSDHPGMTVLEYHSAADRCRILPAISVGTGAAHGAPRRRFTSTSIQ